MLLATVVAVGMVSPCWSATIRISLRTDIDEYLSMAHMALWKVRRFRDSWSKMLNQEKRKLIFALTAPERFSNLSIRDEAGNY